MRRRRSHLDRPISRQSNLRSHPRSSARRSWLSFVVRPRSLPAAGSSSGYGTMLTSAFLTTPPTRFLMAVRRRFFTIAFLFNFISLLCAATGRWQYPRDYTGAWILGNLLFAILVRTELFGRILYAVLNAAFAKVRGVPRVFPTYSTDNHTVAAPLVPLRDFLFAATSWRHSFRMCIVSNHVVDLQGLPRFQRPLQPP